MLQIRFLKYIFIATLLFKVLSGQADVQDEYSFDSFSGLKENYSQERPVTLPEDPELEDYIRATVWNNPGIAAAYTRWQAEIEKVAVARGLPDPSLGFGVFLTNVETAVGPQEYKLGLTQMIPWFGKLRLSGEIQSLRADIQAELLQAEINDAVYSLTEIFLDYYFLQRSIEITDINIELIKNWENVVRSKYTSARAGHPDLIKTQIELLKLRDDRETLNSKKQPLIEQFIALINDTSLKDINLPDSISRRSMIMDTAELRTWMFETNPLYRSVTLKKKLTDRAVKRSKLNYFPDFGIGIDYTRTGDKYNDGKPVPESGKDPFIVKMELSLPVWVGKIRGEVKAARYLDQNAEELIIAMTNNLNSELEKVKFDLDDFQRKIHLYENGLIPKSIESLRSVEKAYIAEKMDFINLVDAQRRYLQFLLEYERSQVSYLKAFTRLETLVGRDL